MQPFKPQTVPQPGGSNPGAPAVMHETKDVNVRAVLIFLLSLAITGVFAFAICYGIFTGFNRYVDREESAPATWNAEAVKRESDRAALLSSQGRQHAGDQYVYQSRVESFPQPRVQSDDIRDMQMLREQEDLELSHYAWEDQSAGKVSIPIERAIALMAQRGLPTIANAPPSGIVTPLTSGVAKVNHESTHNPKE